MNSYRLLAAGGLLLVAVSCRPRTLNLTGQGSCPAGYQLPGWTGTGSIYSATNQAVNQYGNGLTFQDEPGQGDERKLTRMNHGHQELGPLVLMQPACGANRIASGLLSQGVILAKIQYLDSVDTGGYKKLALNAGDVTWVAVTSDTVPGKYRMVFLPAGDHPANPKVSISMQDPARLGPHGLHNWQHELARFVYLANDEGVWVTCTSNWCCSADPGSWQ